MSTGTVVCRSASSNGFTGCSWWAPDWWDLIAPRRLHDAYKVIINPAGISEGPTICLVALSYCELRYLLIWLLLVRALAACIFAFSAYSVSFLFLCLFNPYTGNLHLFCTIANQRSASRLALHTPSTTRSARFAQLNVCLFVPSAVCPISFRASRMLCTNDIRSLGEFMLGKTGMKFILKMMWKLGYLVVLRCTKIK